MLVWIRRVTYTHVVFQNTSCLRPYSYIVNTVWSHAVSVTNSSMHGLQVRMTVVLDHVLDTVQHLLKKKVALERAVDPATPDIIADGSRIVQVGVLSGYAIYWPANYVKSHVKKSFCCTLLAYAGPGMHEQITLLQPFLTGQLPQIACSWCCL